ncbi:putative signal peptide and transmembrane protein [Rhodopirellula islandica]|uniref:Signal peptide and transmembrane protein n=1 Tax=Rhodopirellula islandica TaxID=595434 RepID=A0A0J1BAA4_RHOIS|nr:putative signal peptide and transmembrane protein [Rhodopirellula islandica]
MRDGFAAIRELILVLAMLALFLTPTTVREILQEAGIRSFAGVEFDEETLTEVENAESRVIELETQLALAQSQLESIANISSNRADPRLGSVSRLLANAQQSASEMSDSLGEAKGKQIELWQRSGRPPRSHGREETPDTEQPEIEQALITPAELFNR